MRQAIDRKSAKLKNILMADAMRKEFFGGIKADEAKAVKAFIEINKESALKTKPKVLLRARWMVLMI